VYLIINPIERKIERLGYDSTLERISSTDVLEFGLFPPAIVVPLTHLVFTIAV